MNKSHSMHNQIRRCLWGAVGVLLVGLALSPLFPRSAPAEAPENPPAPVPQPLGLATPDEFVQPTTEARLAAVGDLQQIPVKWRSFFQPTPESHRGPDPGPSDWLAQHPEPHQSFALFLKEKPHRVDRLHGTIYLLPLDEFDEYVPQLEDLRKFMQQFYAMPTQVLPQHTFPEKRITSRINSLTHRSQWLSTDILRELQPLIPKDAYCLLGVTLTDLYPDPKWNFVYGQATFKQRVGIYSFARFAPAFWGHERTPEARRTMLHRSCKLIAHETGHMFGIRHCVYYSCVMNGGNHQDEFDSRPLCPCPVCMRKLYWSIGFDPEKREQELQQEYTRLGITDRPLKELLAE